MFNKRHNCSLNSQKCEALPTIPSNEEHFIQTLVLKSHSLFQKTFLDNKRCLVFLRGKNKPKFQIAKISSHKNNRFNNWKTFIIYRNHCQWNQKLYIIRGYNYGTYKESLYLQTTSTIYIQAINNIKLLSTLYKIKFVFLNRIT